MAYCNSPECKGAEVETVEEPSDNGHDDHTFQAFTVSVCAECGSGDFLFADAACSVPYEYDGYESLEDG